MPTGSWAEFWSGAAGFVTEVGLPFGGGILLCIVVWKWLDAWGRKMREGDK